MFYRALVSSLYLLALIVLNGCGSDEDGVKDDQAIAPSEKTPALAPEPEPEVLRISLEGDYSAEDVTLRWAAWGGQGEWADATEYIRAKLAKSGAYTCSGASLVREIGDPGPKYANALILLFDTLGGPLKIGMNNTSWLRMNLQGSELNPPGGPLADSEIKRMNEYLGSSKSPGNQIVWARWGRSKFGNHWVDAYSITQDLIAKDGRVRNSTRGFPLEHPVTDRDKFLQVLISMGGQVMKFQMWGAWFELSPSEQAQLSPVASAAE